MTQFHFKPETYLVEVRREVPAFDELQYQAAKATGIDDVHRVLDLGTGTGETALAVLRRHPSAVLHLLDESADMLAISKGRLPSAQVEDSLVGDMRGPLPDGPFDLVASALAVHHISGTDKQALFARVHDRLRPGGRFVLADVVIPDDPIDAVTPLSPGFDMPDRVDDLLTWLGGTGFTAAVTWESGDLAVIAANRDRA
ncbi:MAG: class I SAM-dependent methyltransferase [Actinomycetota bacterium]|nr:class I SAM-dependent methyltransferase [Actinomycetota bacterium]